MNRVILMGRLTRDPEIRYSQNSADQMAIARFTLAVDRRFKRDGENTADFINCKAFGRTAEFMRNYTHQGTKLCVEGRIETGSYVKQDGTKVYTTEVILDNVEFAESKAAEAGRQGGMAQSQGQNQGQWQRNQQPMQGGQGYNQPYGGQQPMQGGQGYNQSYSGQQPMQGGQSYNQSYGGQQPMQNGQGYNQSYSGQQPMQGGQGFGQHSADVSSGSQSDDPQSFMAPPVSDAQGSSEAQGEGFMSIPDAVDDEGLPFG